MSRLIAGLGALFVYFCVGTILAQSIIVGYANWKGFVDRQKLRDMLAIAHGATLASAADNTPDSGKKTETLTIDELDQRRAMLTRRLELREQAVQNALQQIDDERDKLRQEREAFDLLVAAFRKERQTTESQEVVKGQEDVRQMLENIKPRLAKDYILKMIDDDEKQQVVAILSAMPITKQKKIIEEFKDDDEKTKLYEILQLIQQGAGELNKSVDSAEPSAAAEPRQP
jgi:hypothetical protein